MEWQGGRVTNVDWLIVKGPRDDSDRPPSSAELTVKDGVMSFCDVST